MNSHNAYNVLRKYWDPRVSDNTRNMKGFRDGSGVVFDIRSEAFEAFMDNYDRLKETDKHIDFELQKCTELPDLEDEGGYGGGGNWRDQGKDNFRPSRGGGGGYGGDRGGYGGSSGGYGGRGGGGGFSRDNNRGGGGGDWGNRDTFQKRDNGYGDRNGYDNNFNGGGGNWRDQDSSRGGGMQRRGGYQESNFQGQFGQQKRDGPTRGDAPIIGNKAGPSKSKGSMVFVSNLKFTISEQELMDFFKQNKFEPIRARLLYDTEGNSKGSGFVELASEELALESVEKLGNQEF
jgi:hypothetical protein